MQKEEKEKEEVQEDEEDEIITKLNVWGSSSDEDVCGDEQTQNKLTLLGFKFDLETIRNKGFQNPKFVICLILILFAITDILMLFFQGYTTSWDLLAFLPVLIGVVIEVPVMLYELNESYQAQKTNIQKMYLPLAKSGICTFFSISIFYSIIFNTPFNNITYYFTALFSQTLIQCYIACLCGNYQNSPKSKLQLNSNNDKITNVRKIVVQQKNNNNNKITQVRNKNMQILKESQQKTYISEEKWAIYIQRLWDGLVLAVMYVDVLSDVYYGYILFYAYGKFGVFLRISGITLMTCCIADLGLVLYMIIFPGWVNHSAHIVAFFMEIPNFVVTGISIWKIRQLMYRDQIEDDEGQQLAIFSIITTSLNALIHVVYIVDSWAVKNAIEYMQAQK